MGAKQGDTVKVHYTGKLEDGTVFDSSEEREPLEFKIGEGHIIPGFEEAVVGMEVDSSTSVSVTPDKAYGPKHDGLIAVIKRSDMPEGVDPMIGMTLEFASEEQKYIARIVKIEGDEITVDANHPLAGCMLSFDIRLLEIEQG